MEMLLKNKYSGEISKHNQSMDFWRKQNNCTAGVAFSKKRHAVIMQCSRWFYTEKNWRQSVLQGGGRPSKAGSNCLMVLLLAVCPAKLFIFARENAVWGKTAYQWSCKPQEASRSGVTTQQEYCLAKIQFLWPSDVSRPSTKPDQITTTLTSHTHKLQEVLTYTYPFTC